ncbi:hypothetical protein [Paenibacillus sp. B1-33]|uniref:hypothetical protein n=1 Tax=unclassified Paenibacillus TaxID=185978 RepID=UPI003D2CD36A
MKNKQPTSTKTQLVIALFIILLSFGILWYLISLLFSVFKGLQKEVAAALIAASATIVVSVLSVVVAKYYEKKRAIEQEHRNKKIPMYEEFVEFLFKILMNKKLEGEPLTEQEMLKFMSAFTQKLLVWGSDDVVLHWSKYRMMSINDKSDAMENMFQMEELLYAIRRDTGHKNKKHKKGDILKLFINDIDKYL